VAEEGREGVVEVQAVPLLHFHQRKTSLEVTGRSRFR
jgi:hypothetical protein